MAAFLWFLFGILVTGVGITIFRVRRLGVSWWTIASAPSRWLQFIWWGDGWTHTTCARVAHHVEEYHRPRWFWVTFEKVLNFMFLWVERNHCAHSLQRCGPIEEEEIHEYQRYTQ
jgi:hypothetical protein